MVSLLLRSDPSECSLDLPPSLVASSGRNQRQTEAGETTDGRFRFSLAHPVFPPNPPRLLAHRFRRKWGSHDTRCMARPSRTEPCTRNHRPWLKSTSTNATRSGTRRSHGKPLVGCSWPTLSLLTCKGMQGVSPPLQPPPTHPGPPGLSSCPIASPTLRSRHARAWIENRTRRTPSSSRPAGSVQYLFGAIHLAAIHRDGPRGGLKGHEKPAQGKRASRRASPWVSGPKRPRSPVGARQALVRARRADRLPVCLAPLGLWGISLGVLPRAAPLADSGLALGYCLSPRWG